MEHRSLRRSRFAVVIVTLAIAAMGIAGCTNADDGTTGSQSEDKNPASDDASRSSTPGDSDDGVDVSEADAIPLAQAQLMGVWATPTSEQQPQGYRYVFKPDKTFAIYQANSNVLAMNGDYRLDETERELRLYVRKPGSETLLSLERLKPVGKREGGDQLIFKRLSSGDALWLRRVSETPQLQSPSQQPQAPDG